MDIVQQDIGSVNTSQVDTLPPRVDTLPKPTKNLRKQRERARSKVRSLDSDAISARKASEVVRLEFCPGGVIAKRTCYSSPGEPVIRGEVKGLSRKSAKRLREKLVRIDWGALVPPEGKSERAFLVTVTYPKEFPEEWREHKAHFKSLVMRLRRQFGDVALLWRLEHQKRTAPHYHVILVLPDNIDKRRLKRWLLRSWFEVVGSADPWHLRRGVDVQALYGKPGALMRYLSKALKYLGKQDGGSVRNTGRCWGVWGELPEGDTLVVTLTWERWCQFTRRLRRWGKGSRYVEGITASWRGFLVFGADEQTRQLLRGLWQYSEPGVDYAR